jgi:Pyridoxamine 5'-phosphate oxidase
MSASPADVTAEIHGFSDPHATPTPWTEGLQEVIAADTFWLSTVRADGRPHVTPLIAVWHRDAIWFCTGADERKARNLAENPACILTTGRSDLAAGALDVVLEGEAEQITDNRELEPIAEAFATKYGTAIWDFVVRDGAFSQTTWLFPSSPASPPTGSRTPRSQPSCSSARAQSTTT